MTLDVPNLPVTLKRARKAARFSNAKDFLAAVKASGKKAPSYSTYAQWESGEVTPRDETLEPIIEYHRERKTWPEEVSGPDLATALMALTRELEAARLERAATEAQLADLRAVVESLIAQVGASSQAPDARSPSAGSAG